MESEKERLELIENFGIHFETFYHIPPLGARILATLIVECKEGITFEALVEKMNASKSTVSTNLNLLQKLGKITYFTRPGDRKKYFKPAPFSERLASYLRIVAFEKDMIDRMRRYRERTASGELQKCDLENIKAYKDHILEVEQLLMRTIAKFKEIENKNK